MSSRTRWAIRSVCAVVIVIAVAGVGVWFGAVPRHADVRNVYTGAREQLLDESWTVHNGGSFAERIVAVSVRADGAELSSSAIDAAEDTNTDVVPDRIPAGGAVQILVHLRITDCRQPSHGVVPVRLRLAHGPLQYTVTLRHGGRDQDDPVTACGRR